MCCRIWHAYWCCQASHFRWRKFNVVFARIAEQFEICHKNLRGTGSVLAEKCFHDRTCISYDHNVTLCRNWYFVWFGNPHSFWVQHHCHEHKSQVCKPLSGVMLLLTTNKAQYVITVENLHLEVNMYVTLILHSHWRCIVQKQVLGGLRQRRHSPYYKTLDTWHLNSTCLKL